MKNREIQWNVMNFYNKNPMYINEVNYFTSPILRGKKDTKKGTTLSGLDTIW